MTEYASSRLADSDQKSVAPSFGDERLLLNNWPWIFLLLIVISGMVYSLYFAGQFHYHTRVWITPGDFWNTFRASQYVTWGGESQIYNNPASFQTFPGIAFLLAPVVKLSDVLHLTIGYLSLIARPSAWWLLGPTELALGGVLLFPLDRLARRFSFDSRRRILVQFVAAVLIWPSVAIWGHPEDALSLAIGIYALVAAYDRNWLRAGVMMGVAIAVQPLILLTVPIAVACLPIRRWVSFGLIAVTPALLLLASPLVQEWGPTIKILTKQPNFPLRNHPTPWISLAPVLTRGHYGLVQGLKHVKTSAGHFRAIEVSTRELYSPVVAAGPGRIVAVVLACVIGLYVMVRKPSLARIMWWAGLSLSLRCLLEPVMVPYYLLPGLALALVVVPLNGPRRWLSAVVLAGVCTWASYRHVGPWDYYVTMGIPLLATLHLAWPRETARQPNETPPVTHEVDSSTPRG